MKKFQIVVIFIIMINIIAGCKVSQEIPPDGVVLYHVITAEDFKKRVPQTIILKDGNSVVFKMPEKLEDGDVIKIGKVKGQKWIYFVKVKFTDDGGKEGKK